MEQRTYDYVIIGSGFGGSVSAMRLTEKGYSVLILEKGRRFRDQDFAKTNWQFWKYLWMPALRAYGILQISLLKGAMILHGTGVGGGSLGFPTCLKSPPMRPLPRPPGTHPLPGGRCSDHFIKSPGKCSVRRAIPGFGRPMNFYAQ